MPTIWQKTLYPTNKTKCTCNTTLGTVIFRIIPEKTALERCKAHSLRVHFCQSQILRPQSSSRNPRTDRQTSALRFGTGATGIPPLEYEGEDENDERDMNNVDVVVGRSVDLDSWSQLARLIATAHKKMYERVVLV